MYFNAVQKSLRSILCLTYSMYALAKCHGSFKTLLAFSITRAPIYGSSEITCWLPGPNLKIQLFNDKAALTAGFSAAVKLGMVWISKKHRKFLNQLFQRCIWASLQHACCGLECAYTCSADNQIYIQRNRSASITSPGYPDLYCFGMSCKWNITTDQGSSLTLHFTFGSKLGQLDKVTVYGVTNNSNVNGTELAE